MGDQSMGDQSMGDQSMGDQSMGDQSMGDQSWAGRRCWRGGPLRADVAQGQGQSIRRVRRRIENFEVELLHDGVSNLLLVRPAVTGDGQLNCRRAVLEDFYACLPGGQHRHPRRPADRYGCIQIAIGKNLLDGHNRHIELSNQCGKVTMELSQADRHLHIRRCSEDAGGSGRQRTTGRLNDAVTTT